MACKTRILVAGTDEPLARAWTQTLAKDFYDVTVEEDADRALGRAKELQPDVAVLDAGLCTSPGSSLASEITKVSPQTVAVAIVDPDVNGMAERAMSAGACPLLRKPFTDSEFQAAVARALICHRRASEAFRFKSEKARMAETFANTLNQEIRPSLIAVEQYLEILLNETGQQKANAQFRSVLERSRARLRQVLTLINELMRISHPSGGLMLRLAHGLNLLTLVTKAVEGVRSQATERRISMVLRFPEDLPMIEGDENALVEVFRDLASNAVQYNRDGGMVQFKGADKGDSVAVTCTDTGMGIPEESLPFVFDEFFQVKGEGPSGGLGLGLSRVKRIVEAHQGNIEVGSRLGQGTTFTVYLPKKQPRMATRK